MLKSNFHTHSKFCDGSNTIEEMVLSAISKGFTDLGFSGHGYTADDLSYCMSKDGTAEYIKAVKEAELKYSDKINIYLGVEKDYISNESNSDFQYVIGSVHYVKAGGVYYPIDSSPQCTKTAIESCGSLENYFKIYFETVSKIVSKTDCDIIGHFDLLDKYFNPLKIAKPDNYLKLAEAAVDALIPFGKPFEINTGAIARGIDHGIYPAPEILKMIFAKGGKITLCSDCHNKDFLDCYYAESLEIAKEIGFKSIVSRHGDSFQEFDINEFKA